MEDNKSIHHSFLFKNISAEDIRKLIASVPPLPVTYTRGEAIYTPDGYEKKMGIVLSGECTVERVKPSGDRVPLNSLYPSDAFGILAVFAGDDEFPTYITAKKRAEIVFYSREDLEQLMKLSHSVSMNLLTFLADRALFLCGKVSSFSSDNIEQRLAMYLYNLYLSTGSNIVKINKKRVAEELNTGRTSLYRALDSLQEGGFISIDDKTIIIIDLEGLERISK